MVLVCSLLSLVYALYSLVVAFPNVMEEDLSTEGWLLLNPLILCYSALAVIFGVCCHYSPSLRLYSPLVPACLGALLACAVKLVAALTAQTLDGLSVSPGGVLVGITLAGLALFGRFWFRDRVGTNDRVGTRQLLTLCFYYAFLLLLILPLEGSTDYTYSNSASFTCIVLAQTLLGLVTPTQAVVLQVFGRRSLLSSQSESKKPAFRQFRQAELSRDTF